jgi:hypothetical protein
MNSNDLNIHNYGTVLDEIAPPPVDEEIWTGLKSLPDRDEIKKAIKKMKNDKAAGVSRNTGHA